MYKSFNKQVKVAIDSAVEKAVIESALVAEDKVVHLTPVDTGRLRASIAHNTESDRFQVGTNVEYAVYVEKGTSKQKAQPFLKPGINRTVPLIQGIVKKYLKELSK